MHEVYSYYAGEALHELRPPLPYIDDFQSLNPLDKEMRRRCALANILKGLKKLLKPDGKLIVRDFCGPDSNRYIALKARKNSISCVPPPVPHPAFGDTSGCDIEAFCKNEKWNFPTRASDVRETSVR